MNGNIWLTIAAIIFGLMTLPLGAASIVSAVRGKMRLFRRFGACCLTTLAIASASAIGVSGILSTTVSNNGTNGIIPMSETQEPSDDTVEVIDLAGGEADPIAAINLTQRQIDAILKNYSLDFDDGCLPSRLGDRQNAIQVKFGTSYGDPVYFPIPDEMVELADKIIACKDPAEKSDLNDQFMHELRQMFIDNPPFGLMWAEGFLESELITTNNPWILAELAIAEEIYTGAFQELDPKSEGYAERSKLDLAYATIPSDPKSVGLDYLLTAKSDGSMQVSKPWANFAVKIGAVLDHLVVSGYTTQTSTVHWSNMALVDSLARMTKATYPENKKSIRLSLIGKNEQEVDAWGMNCEDSRTLYYGQPAAPVIPSAQPTPTPSSTPAPTPTPSNTPEPTPTITVTPPPSEAPKLYSVLIEYVREGDGMQVATPHTNSNLPNGTSYNVESPKVVGYVPDLENVQVEIRNGNFYKRVVYHPVDCPVNVLHYYVGTTTHVAGTTDVHTTVKYGTRYEYTPPTIAGYVHTPTYISEEIRNTAGRTFIVYYGKDGQGMKDKTQDPVNQSNAPEGGYPNESDAGTGEVQATQPPLHDFGTGSTTTNPPIASDPPRETHDSTKPVTGPGNVVQGDVPATPVLPPVKSEAKDDVTKQEFNPAAENNNNVVVGGDDF